MMSRYTDADVIVIGLIGERGREVNEFLERDLGPEGLARSVVVVATSNEPALTRVQGRVHRHGRRRILPRQGQQRAAADGFGHAVRHGPARDRPGRRRAADDARLSALDVRLLPRLVERAGQARSRQHHRVLLRARRRRRRERTGRRHGARPARRPRLAVAQARRPRPLPGRRRAAEHQPVDERRRQRPNTRPPPR